MPLRVWSDEEAKVGQAVVVLLGGCMRWFLCILVATNLAATSTSSAQTPQQTPTVWQLDWQQSHCTISTIDKDRVTLSLWMLPGDPDPHLYLIGPRKLLPTPDDKVTVQLGPNDETFDAVGYVQSPKDPSVVRILQLRHKFPHAFAASREVRVTANGKQIAVPIPGAAKAMAALQECIDQKLPEWGVDPKAYNALPLPPTDLEGESFLSPDDYPTELLDANWSGDVIVRLNVDATGKVTNCAVVVSSGQQSADRVTCLRAVQKAKLNPAVGADGKPTPALRIRDVVFRIAS